MNKKTLRKKLLYERKQINNNELIKKSNQIISNLISIPFYKNSKTILVYVSYNHEVITHDFILNALTNNKIVVIPICNTKNNTLNLSTIKKFPDDLIPNAYGILEVKQKKVYPITLDEIDLILVPGLAFSKNGNRLGYGGGYYDRLLSNNLKKIPTIGLVLDQFVLNTIPHKKHDINIDYILSENRFIKCNK